MKHTLRIAVADDDRDMRDYLQTVLPLGGHEVIGAVGSGEELVELCVAEHPDLAITDIKMPDMDGLDAARIIGGHWAMPFIVISGYYDANLLTRAEGSNVMAYLVKPIKLPDLETALPLALHRFEQWRSAREEAAELRVALAERKVVERAKGIVAKRLAMDEDNAFRRLRKLASDNNLKLVQTAQRIVDAEGIFHDLERL